MFKLTILILCFLVGPLFSKAVEDESPGKIFVTDISARFSDVSTVLTEATLKTKNKNLTEEETQDLVVKILSSLKTMTNLVEEIFHYELNENEDEEVKIGYKKLKVMTKLYALGDDYFKWVRDNLEKFLERANYCEYKHGNDECTTTYNTIVEKIKNTTDSDEILFYWMESREKNLLEAKTKMLTFIELLKKLGTKHENTAKYALFSDYLDGRLDIQMENILQELNPLFQEIHGYVRYMLHQKYRDEVPLTGLIPHHLYEQAMFQAWKPDAVIAKDFKDVNIPIDRHFNETAEDVMHISSNFMKSLGLTELPDDFWSKHVIKSNTLGDDCFPFLYDTGKTIYFEYCDDVNIRNFLQMHGNFARIYYANEQAMFQAWKPDAVIAKDFKDVNIPIDRHFNETAEDVMHISSNFMKSLGLTELPDDFWSKHVIKSNTLGDDCFPFLYDTGKTIYFEYCDDVNIRNFLQMHGNFARIYYANERKNLSFAYMEPFNIEYAVGEAVILAASTPKYLQGTEHKDFVQLKDDEDINILFRRAIHTFLNIPEYFVHVKVIADVLDEKISVDNLNKHYWDLMAKYVGVGPPTNRNSEAFDFPLRFYKKVDNNLQTIKFVSEIMGYQIYEALCKESGEYVKDDHNLQLHNCNFENSKKAGSNLQKMMQLGAKKPWKQVLGKVTGDEDGMKAEPILEYYKPLQKWLNIKNKEYNVKIGW